MIEYDLATGRFIPQGNIFVARNQMELSNLLGDSNSYDIVRIAFGTSKNPAMIYNSPKNVECVLIDEGCYFKGADIQYLYAQPNSHIQLFGLFSSKDSHIVLSDNTKLIVNDKYWDITIYGYLNVINASFATINVNIPENYVFYEDKRNIIYAEGVSVVHSPMWATVFAESSSIIRHPINCNIVLRDYSQCILGYNLVNSIVAYDDSRVIDYYIPSHNINFIGHDRSKFITEFNERYGNKIFREESGYLISQRNNLQNYLESRNIKVNQEGKALLYKAVHKNPTTGTYFSDYDNNFIYKIGETISIPCDPNQDIECSYGIHVAPLDWAYIYGLDWDDEAVLELEVDIEDIVVPYYSGDKVRVSSAKVIREVSLGELNKILTF